MRPILAFVCSILLFSCNSSGGSIEQKEPSLNTQPQETNTQNEPVKKKKLRYVYAANGGLLGFFDDGTTSGCPRCDLVKENIKTLYSQPTNGTYTADNAGILLNGSDRMDFKDDGWAMVDYKWLIDL